jgi:ABC-type Fe3+-hydroxamate transport system substrate-binding protein
MRNAAMLDLQPDLVIAFSNGSPGTNSTMTEARRRGIPVEVHSA